MNRSKNSWRYGALLSVAASLMVAECSAYVPSENQNIVIDNDGNMIAAWLGTDDTYYNHHVTASTSADGVTWTTPETITPLTSDDITRPILTLDSQGNCLAVWVTYDYVAEAFLLMSAWLPSAGSWQTPVAISSTSETAQGAFTVRVNSTDQVVVTWQSNDTNFNSVIEFAMTTFGSSWTSPLIISDNS